MEEVWGGARVVVDGVAYSVATARLHQLNASNVCAQRDLLAIAHC